MTEPINAYENQDCDFKALIIDPHSQYGIEKILEAQGIYFRLIFDGYALDEYMELSDLQKLFHKIVNDHPKSESEWRVGKDQYPLFFVYRIFGKGKEHIKAVRILVEMFIRELKTVSGNDSYFDYFPITVEALLLYAQSIGCEDLLKPLTRAIFSEDSEYIHDENCENAYDLFSHLPGAPQSVDKGY